MDSIFKWFAYFLMLYIPYKTISGLVLTAYRHIQMKRGKRYVK